MQPHLSILPEYSHWLPVMIFCARIVDVSIGTLRLICITRSRKVMAVILGFFEILVWILAISSVFTYLDRWINIVAYAGGFATGNAVGMQIEKMLAMGTQMVQLISRGGAHAVAERLRFAGLTVTTICGHGRDGPVSICLAVVPRKMVPTVIAMAQEIDPDVFVTIEDAVATHPAQAAAVRPSRTFLLPPLRSSFTLFPSMFRRPGNGTSANRTNAKKVPPGQEGLPQDKQG